MKIIVTESQLLNIIKNNVAEQEAPKNTNIEGRQAIINDDGTLSILNKFGKEIKIRIKTGIWGDVNFVNFFKKKDDGDYHFKTKKGTENDFKLDKVKSLLQYVDSSNNDEFQIDSSIKTGKIYAVKL